MTEEYSVKTIVCELKIGEGITRNDPVIKWGDASCNGLVWIDLI